MWTSDLAQRFTIDLDILEDDLPFTRRGWSFLNSDSNQLENGYDWMAAKGSIQRGKRRLLRVNGTWQLRAVRRWLEQATYFLERLLFAVHSMYGPVSRGTEITAIRFRKGALETVLRDVWYNQISQEHINRPITGRYRVETQTWDQRAISH
ncbi:hypothetical protein LTS03_011780 [Exophiala xenobiotica]|nr:hypothetical protein LTR92_010706 [Exophiala xenobiotica]KAK5202558.1 hypothetical protein LTR41_011693 [Exophiala xenobiotica]KAK5243281.1 hypothetical protein LTS06_010917 [Exophiala xenobiotica]KAK5355123.1 hypothetical protein LTR11_011787 [Exophiala xenobiotica]KAK5356066.1 hypothetical protein LTS03_011780 [Exophiala xenobiotica]